MMYHMLFAVHCVQDKNQNWVVANPSVNTVTNWLDIRKVKYVFDFKNVSFKLKKFDFPPPI